MDLLSFIGVTLPAAIAIVLSAFSQYRISLNNREISVLKAVAQAHEERALVQDRTIVILRSEIEDTNRQLEEEKRLRAADQQMITSLQQTIASLNIRIAELEGMDKRRRRGMAQFEERGLG